MREDQYSPFREAWSSENKEEGKGTDELSSCVVRNKVERGHVDVASPLDVGGGVHDLMGMKLSERSTKRRAQGKTGRT
jgi:hypothetical protein